MLLTRSDAEMAVKGVLTKGGAEQDAHLNNLPMESELGLIDSYQARDFPERMAMLVQNAAKAAALFGDAEIAIGMADGLLWFWEHDERMLEWADESTRIGQVGAAATVKADALLRLREAGGARSVYDRFHDRLDAAGDPNRTATHLSLLVAAELANEERFDEGRAYLPNARPDDQPGTASLYDTVVGRYESAEQPGEIDTLQGWDEMVGQLEKMLSMMVLLEQSNQSILDDGEIETIKKAIEYGKAHRPQPGEEQDLEYLEKGQELRKMVAGLAAKFAGR